MGGSATLNITPDHESHSRPAEPCSRLKKRDTVNGGFFLTRISLPYFPSRPHWPGFGIFFSHPGYIPDGCPGVHRKIASHPFIFGYRMDAADSDKSNCPQLMICNSGCFRFRNPSSVRAKSTLRFASFRLQVAARLINAGYLPDFLRTIPDRCIYCQRTSCFILLHGP